MTQPFWPHCHDPISIKSDHNNTIWKHIKRPLNPLLSTWKYVSYYHRNHVEYSVTIHILSRHYSDSGAFHLPLPPLGHPTISERVHRHIVCLWDDFWKQQWTPTGHGPPFGAISILIMFLKCFSFWSYPVAIESACSSTIAYLQPWSVVYLYPYLISIPPRTLSHSLPFLNSSKSLYINTRLLHVYFSSSIIICLLILPSFSL